MAEDRVLSDREQWFAREETLVRQDQVLESVRRGQCEGVGAAAFVIAMAKGLEDESFTREERVALIKAALCGR